MRRVNVYLFLLIAIGLPLSSFAQDGAGFGGENSTSIEAPRNDDGTYSLDTISEGFGGSDNIGYFIVKWVTQGASFSDPNDSLLGAISNVLNGAALTLAIIVMGYNSLMYAVFTAKHGVPGGAKIAGGVSTVRNAFAVAMLTPIIANGFSPVQALVNQAANMGVFFADETVLYASQYMETEGPILESPLVGVRDAFWGIVQAETCHRLIEAEARGDQATGALASDFNPTPFRVTKDGSYIRYEWGFTDWTQKAGFTPTLGAAVVQYMSNKSDANICGTLVLELPAALEDKVEVSESGELQFIDGGDSSYFSDIITLQHQSVLENKAQIREITRDFLYEDFALLNELTIVQARGLASIDEIEAMYGELETQRSFVEDTLPQWGIQLSILESNFKSQLEALSNTAAQRISGDMKSRSSEGYTWHDELAEKGFVALGSFYLIQIQTSTKILEAGENRLAVDEGPDFISEDSPLSQLSTSEKLQEADRRLKAVFKSMDSHSPSDEFEINLRTVRGGGIVPDGEESGLIQKLKDYAYQGMDSLIKLLTGGNGDLIMRINAVGAQLVKYMEIAFLVLAMLFGLSKIAGVFGGFATKAVAAVAGESISAIASTVVTAMLFILGLGLILQLAIPFIPFLYWIVGIQSWAMAIFLSMIFAPLWMMSHTRASADDWVSEHNRNGYMMLVEIVLRPTLMCFGFYGAMILMKISSIAMDLALPYLFGLMADWTGLPGMAFSLILVGYLAYKLVARTYSLIHETVDHILQRLGSGLQPLGEVGESQSGATTVLGMYRNVNAATTGAASKLKGG